MWFHKSTILIPHAMGMHGVFIMGLKFCNDPKNYLMECNFAWPVGCKFQPNTVAAIHDIL